MEQLEHAATGSSRCRSTCRAAIAVAAIAALAACAVPGSGPSTRRIGHAGAAMAVGQTPIQVIDVTDAVVQQVALTRQKRSFLERLGDVPPLGVVIGRGDSLDISIWEAPPAVLFGSTVAGSSAVGATGVSRSSALPEQVVDGSGQINVPFVGPLSVVGRRPGEVAAEIQRRLEGKANSPQVVVRRLENSSATVTVVGDVQQSRRVPLTPKGERLLDVLASAGGTKEPIGKVTVQVTRGDLVTAMPLEAVIRNPAQNVRLTAGDVLTVLFQPYSFTALGAVNNNAEIPFEATGMTVAQALGRIGGLQDQRSDPKGVFVFRMQEVGAGAEAGVMSGRDGTTNLVPTVYRFDMRNPATLFLMQRFEIRNKDVVYVSNSPTSDIQKFLGLLSSAAFSLTGIGTVIP